MACWAIGLLMMAGPVLDRQAADRMIELALEAELAGDFDGAKDALDSRLSKTFSREEELGRQRLQAWLSSARFRRAGFGAKAGRLAALEAWQSLEPFSPTVHDRVWFEFSRRQPHLQSALTPVALKVDRTLGFDEVVTQSLLEKALRQRSVPMDQQGLELAISIDASKMTSDGRWKVARTELAFVLTSTSAAHRPLALFARARTERRLGADEARSMAVRRLGLDAAHAVLFTLRSQALSRSWTVGPSSHSDK